MITRKNKKGQAAFEFLMTYGWAIIIVLAAIGALAYVGVIPIPPPSYDPEQHFCDEYQYYKEMPRSCIEWRAWNIYDDMRIGCFKGCQFVTQPTFNLTLEDNMSNRIWQYNECTYMCEGRYNGSKYE